MGAAETACMDDLRRKQRHGYSNRQTDYCSVHLRHLSGDYRAFSTRLRERTSLAGMYPHDLDGLDVRQTYAVQGALHRLPGEAIAVDRRHYVYRRAFAAVAKHARRLDDPLRAVLGPHVVAEAAVRIKMPGNDAPSLGFQPMIWPPVNVSLPSLVAM